MSALRSSIHTRHSSYISSPRNGHMQIGMPLTRMTELLSLALNVLILFAGILYAKYKSEKLMEHLKLFSKRLNIPRLIRVCEENHHWKELVFLYVQYDEYDNAALVMMSHSPIAWEHVQFKDVAVKVSNVEVYYRAISFYLEEHPDLLNDLLKVRSSLRLTSPRCYGQEPIAVNKACVTYTSGQAQVLEARVDHARVVLILRKADHLPLVKDYLLAVQKTNLAAVNEAVNELLIEEEDYDALRESITTYDNYDQLGLATQLEQHELTEFRRIAAHIYKANLRWRKAVALAQQDHLYKVSEPTEPLCEFRMRRTLVIQNLTGCRQHVPFGLP